MRTLVSNAASQPITNHFRNPGARNGNDGFGVYWGADGATGVTEIADADWTTSGKCYRTTYTNVGQGNGHTDLRPGAWAKENTRYTFVYKRRSSVAGNLSAPWVYPSAGTSVVARHTTTATYLQAGEVDVAWITVDFISGWNPGWQIYFRHNAFTNGQYLEIGDVVMYEGDYNPALCNYFDGNTPGWRWSGTPYASTSIGHPYTLESIAGKPQYDISDAVVGTSLNTSATDDLTIYAVCSDTTPSTTSGLFQGYGPNQDGSEGGRSFRVMYDFTDASRLHLGRFSSTDTLPASINSGSGWRSSINITGASLPSGSGASKLFLNNNTTQSHSGITNPPHNFRNTSSVIIGVRDNNQNTDLVTHRFLVYRGTHSEQTMRQIQGWLARHYGGSLPANY